MIYQKRFGLYLNYREDTKGKSMINIVVKTKQKQQQKCIEKTSQDISKSLSGNDSQCVILKLNYTI